MGVGAAAAIVGAPAAIGAAGFGAGGIAAGSLAAQAMSGTGTTVIAGLQSVGAAGFCGWANTVIGAAAGYFLFMNYGHLQRTCKRMCACHIFKYTDVHLFQLGTLIYRVIDLTDNALSTLIPQYKNSFLSSFIFGEITTYVTTYI